MDLKEKNKISKKTLFLIPAVIFSLVFVESVSRLYSLAPGPRLFVHNPDFGWFHAAGFETVRNDVLIKINSAGLRDEEHSYEKGEDVFRILVLGDSFAEALQVPVEAAFTEQLEDLLNQENSGIRYEVVNSGVSGFGTGNEYLFYTSEGRKYDPDLVLLLFFFNDVYDNYERPVLLVQEGAVMLNPDADEIVRQAFPELSSALWDYSYAYRNAALSIKILRGVAGHRNSDVPVNRLYRIPPPAGVQPAWEVTETILLALAGEVEADAVPFLVVDLPSEDSMALPQIAADHDFTQVSKRLESVLSMTQACMISLRSPFLDAVQRGVPVYIEGDGHWSREGQALAAQVVRESLATCMR